MDFLNKMDFLGEHPSVPLGVAALIALYVGAALAMRRRPNRRQAMWFALAMAAILYAHTELDELADARIFAMHMLQHLVQTFVIPPLLLLGTPDWMLRPIVLSRPVKPIFQLLTRPVIAFLLFSAVFVTAHFPAIFDLMCRDENFHIFLHLLFMAVGVLMWWPILSPIPEMPRLSYPAQILYLFLLMIPMTAVAAPITLASTVIYPWYTEGAHGWGIRPMDDQVLGGLLMWIGQGTYLMIVFTLIFFRWSRLDDRDIPAVPTFSRPELRVVPPQSRPILH
jgi:putative membrane protein